MNQRKKISEKLESDILFKSNMLCCVCKQKGHHIHHIDKNPSNNEEDNLVFLCFTCHDNASVEKGLKKNLKPLVLKKFRNEHYETIQIKRTNERKIITGISAKRYEDEFRVSTSSLAYFEIVKRLGDIVTDDDRTKFLNTLFWYSEFENEKIAFKVANILMGMSYHISSKDVEKRALDILSVIMDYFPITYEKFDSNVECRLGEHFLDSGFNMIHDAWFYKNNMRLFCTGFLIYKSIYKTAKFKKNKKLINVIGNFFEKSFNMISEERDIVKRNTGIDVIEVFKKDLEESGLAFPVFSENTNLLFHKNTIHEKK